jgi:hypothetical protein
LISPFGPREARPKRRKNVPRAERFFAPVEFTLTSVAKAGVPARRPKETKVSLTKGFDLCRTFCFLEVRRGLNFALVEVTLV